MTKNRYFLLLEQSGGCDYTIGCGIMMQELKDAHDMDSALDYAEEECKRVESLAKATIYEVGAIDSLDLAGLKRRWAEQRAIAQASANELEERTQLAELKKKYPNA